jgi:inorganic pyrophosphatase
VRWSNGAPRAKPVVPRDAHKGRTSRTRGPIHPRVEPLRAPLGSGQKSQLNEGGTSKMRSPHHPWHDISPGEESPKIVNAIIEIPRDSQLKYELDKESGLLKLDRFLYSAVHYPGDYGFIPQTLWEDGDPMDIIILTNKPVYPLTLVSARVIGVIRMIDNDELDDKIVGVYDRDPRYSEYMALKDIPKHVVAELMHFFETYKELQLQSKNVSVPEILDREKAWEDVKISEENYKKYRDSLAQKVP